MAYKEKFPRNYSLNVEFLTGEEEKGNFLRVGKFKSLSMGQFIRGGDIKCNVPLFHEVQCM